MRRSLKTWTLLTAATSLALAAPISAQTTTPNTTTTSQAQTTAYEAATATTITFQGQSATATGAGVTVTDQTVTITQAGTYILTGTAENLQLVVDAQAADHVHLVLDNLTWTGQGTFLAIDQAAQAVITLAEGSQNRLEETATVDDEDVKALIHSDVALTLDGTGTLAMTAQTKNAVEVEGDLTVAGGTYTATAANHGLKAEGNLTLTGATMTIEAGKDGLHAEVDETPEAANITLNPIHLTITATEDGVDAGGELVIAGGVIDILESEEGLEARVIRQQDGQVTVKSSDDAVNASAGSSASDTTTDTATNTDNAQAPAAPPTAGQTPPTDGQAPAGGPPAGQTPPTDGQAPAGPPARGGMSQAGAGMPGGGMEASDPSLQILIEGGTLTLDAEGDGLDSNGIIHISGGTVVVNGSVQGGNGALDASGDITISGGTVWAFGTADMMQAFATGSTQASLAATLSGTVGTEVIIRDQAGQEVARQTADKDFQAVIVSLAALQDGTTYTVSVGDQTQEVTAQLVTPVSGGFCP